MARVIRCDMCKKILEVDDAFHEMQLEDENGYTSDYEICPDCYEKIMLQINVMED
ncbi:hypothetical protein [Metaclostridioides mangenotii]|uniref:hypothetical protein n=1 Tax=Metaclostridioides mangenotii TaxID=1540 RepID=UPI000B27A722|nr:hypothetical protein [Clostridioides mangenotii]